jgi:signal transduction histidine kinase
MEPRRADGLIALAGGSLGAGIAAIGSEAADRGAGSLAVAALLGVLLGASRRFPSATWITATALLVIGAAWPPFAVENEFAQALLIAAHALCAGRWDPRWRGIAGAVALAAAGELNTAVAHGTHGFFLFAVPATWGAGRALREREQLSARLAERARELDEERDAHAQLSVRYERARIASELHDIVAHAISVMVVQASAGQRLAGHDPEATAEAFEAIAGAARQAEDDMRRLVELLGDEDAIGRAPDLDLLTELVSRAAGSGLHVTLTLEGEREGLAAPVVETTYRVVQEGLTNALRYASGAAVAVLVRGTPQGLLVEVVNDRAAGDAELAGLGTGHGLRGLRERVSACAGKLEAGPTPDGGWRLRAQLPARAERDSASLAQ